jgi:protein-tyrosine phosphatase
MKQLKKTSVLFVCLGNICRSPTAEAVLKKMVQDLGKANDFHIESAGTSSYHVGEPPDSRSEMHGVKRGLQFTSTAQWFNPDIHFEKFDYIVCMDDNNFNHVIHSDASGEFKHKIFKMMDFAPQAEYRFVPDPYTGGSAGFELVLDLIEEACRGLLKKTHPSVQNKK